MTTPTPPAAAPTPERIRKAMETVDELNDSSDACLLAATVVSEWELENKVRRLESELAAKDARIAALEKDKNIDSARLAVALSDALLREFPHMVYGMRIPSHVPENAAAERAYHLGNFARFLASQIDAAREGQKS